VPSCAVSSTPGPCLRRPGRVTQARRADLPLAASPVRGLLAGCVCISLWITCAKRHQACVRAVEMLGIPLLGRAGKGAFNWEDMKRALCTQRNPDLSTHHAAKAVNRSNIDLMVIRLLFRAGTVKRLNPDTASPGAFNGVSARAVARQDHRRPRLPPEPDGRTRCGRPGASVLRAGHQRRPGSPLARREARREDQDPARACQHA